MRGGDDYINNDGTVSFKKMIIESALKMSRTQYYSYLRRNDGYESMYKNLLRFYGNDIRKCCPV